MPRVTGLACVRPCLGGQGKTEAEGESRSPHAGTSSEAHDPPKEGSATKSQTSSIATIRIPATTAITPPTPPIRSSGVALARRLACSRSNARILERTGCEGAKPMQLPTSLRETWQREPKWLDELPRVVAELAAAWDLDLEEPIDTPHSLVVPAGEVVLKVNAPSHFEADHEADALAWWDGRGAVRVGASGRAPGVPHRALPSRDAALGFRRRRAVGRRRAPSADVGRVTEPHPFRLAADEARRWAEEVQARYELGGRPFEHRWSTSPSTSSAPPTPTPRRSSTRTSTAATSSARGASRGS